MNDCTQAIELLGQHKAEAVLADKGYDADAIVEHVEAMGAKAVIPPKRNRKVQREYDKDLYKQRNRIERCFSKLKCFRRFATRYEKSKACFQALVALACAWMHLQAICRYGLVEDLTAYAKAARRVAMEEEGVPVIDLNAESTRLLRTMTQEQADQFDALGHPDASGSTLDRTHLNAHGSEVFGRMVADDLARVCPELGPDVKGQAMPATATPTAAKHP